MNQAYQDGLRNSYKNHDANRWDVRTRKCLRHIVAAVCFRETSVSTYQGTGSVLLSTIGFYYSLFHIGVAALHVEYKTPLEKLERIRHATLRNLIRTHLTNKNLVAEDYLHLLQEAQQLREYANYPFGEDDPGAKSTRLKNAVGKLYQRTGTAFEQVLDYIYLVSKVLDNHLLWYIQVGIADVVGDDLYATYLATDDEKRVIVYLVSKGLTA